MNTLNGPANGDVKDSSKTQGIGTRSSQMSDRYMNSKSRQVEKVFEEKSRELFQSMCKINDIESSIDLNFLRKIMAIGDQKANLSEPVKKIITRHQLSDSIKNGKFRKDSLNEVVFSSEEFCQLISGKNIKNLLFESNESLADKRYNTEEYVKLYELMGGNDKGISKQTLAMCFTSVYKLYSDPERYFTQNDTSIPQANVKNEIDELITLISSEPGDVLSLKDFINAMTSISSFPMEGIEISPSGQ